MHNWAGLNRPKNAVLFSVDIDSSFRSHTLQPLIRFVIDARYTFSVERCEFFGFCCAYLACGFRQQVTVFEQKNILFSNLLNIIWSISKWSNALQCMIPNCESSTHSLIANFLRNNTISSKSISHRLVKLIMWNKTNVRITLQYSLLHVDAQTCIYADKNAFIHGWCKFIAHFPHLH